MKKILGSLVVATAALTLVGTLAPPAVSATEPRPLSGPVVVNPTPTSRGQVITDYGYDVKQGGKAAALANNDALASEIFVTDRFSTLRIPIYAAQAHRRKKRAKGGYRYYVRAREYADVVAAATTVQRVRPDVKIFASLRLRPARKGKNPSEFPAWALGRHGVKPGAYAKLLVQYLAWFKARGVVVHVLGVDNERVFNNGRITPAKYTKIVQKVRRKAAKKGLTVPQFIAPEDYEPTPGWLRGLSARGWGSVNLAGTHYYSKVRDKQLPKLRSFATTARQHHKPLWNTEFHWNTRAGGRGSTSSFSTYGAAVKGLLAAFDQFDNGFSGLTWWSYNPQSRGTPIGQMQSTLVRSTQAYTPMKVKDPDGWKLTRRALSTRAFRTGPGNDFQVWLINDTGQSLYKPVEVKGQRIVVAHHNQWSGPAMSLSGGPLAPSARGRVKVRLPAHSITQVWLQTQ